jgi:excisionase family DNA binding protein
VKEKSSIYPAALKLGGSAQYLSVSKQTMRRLIAKGEIKPIRKLRHLLIPIEELNRWLQK